MDNTVFVKGPNILCMVDANVIDLGGTLSVEFRDLNYVNSEKFSKQKTDIFDIKDGTIYSFSGCVSNAYSAVECVGFSSDLNGFLTKLQMSYEYRYKFEHDGWFEPMLNYEV
jgi:hypothetical protein